MPDKFTHNGETYTRGEEVICQVTWQETGRVTTARGKLHLIEKGEVYIRTEIGFLVGDADTLERA